MLPGLGPEGSHQVPATVITCKSADALDHIKDSSVDVVVMDPPYYDNVMYAELSDYFYVWLKRTAGYVWFPNCSDSRLLTRITRRLPT